MGGPGGRQEEKETLQTPSLAVLQSPGPTQDDTRHQGSSLIQSMWATQSRVDKKRHYIWGSKQKTSSALMSLH